MSRRTGLFSLGVERHLHSMRRWSLARFMIISALLFLANVAHAQSACDANYKFDGDLSDASGNGHSGTAFGRENQPALPQFGEGISGQALLLDGTTGIYTDLDLHFDVCPQVTVTGWLRLNTNEPKGTGYIFSVGANGPHGIYAWNRSIVLRGSGNGLRIDDAMRDQQAWFFFAGVYDFAAGTYRLRFRNRTIAGKLPVGPRKPESETFFGARDDRLTAPARDIYLDEVQIFGRILSEDEIGRVVAQVTSRPWLTALLHEAARNDRSVPDITIPEDARNNRPPNGPSQLPGSIESPGLVRPTGAPNLESSGDGTRRTVERVSDEIENPRIGAPSGAPNLEPSEAAETRDQQQALDASKPPQPVGNPVYSMVAGFTGEIQTSLDLETEFLHEIEWDQKNASPCIIFVKADDANKAGGEKKLDVGCPRELSSVGAKSSRVVRLYPNVVTEIRVCNSRRGTTKLKGIQIGGATIKDDATLLYGGASDAESYTNCKEFTGPMLCPNHWAATGLVVHSADIRSDKGFISGLQLICRRISVG
ncbi:MAG TPA: hypothetical protein PKH39_00155 [Woeseiaceae bacterium]|nr:hypothetical protein [Woeseiaceae bacterium]